ncbi:hypothetical protein Tco_0155273 [Tanacetum coccineum]
MLAPSGGGRKAHLLEDKQILSVGVFDERLLRSGKRQRRPTSRPINQARNDKSQAIVLLSKSFASTFQVKEVAREARGRDALLSFAFVYPAKAVVLLSKSSQTTHPHLCHLIVKYNFLYTCYTKWTTGTDNEEKDEKQSQNDKTGLGMEKTVKDKAKSKPESQSSQKVNRKVNWSKSKSTPTNPKVNKSKNISLGLKL